MATAAKRQRIITPARFADPQIVCIGCECDEYHPCLGGCCWAAIDPDAGVGLCSACAEKPIEKLALQGNSL